MADSTENAVYFEQCQCPSCGENVYVRYRTTPKPQILGLVDKHGVIVTKSPNPNIIDTIYKFWNDQHIIVHRNMTPDITRAIKGELKNYSETDIMQAIMNYAEIYRGEQYWFNYAWTLKDFLKRGLPKFLDLDIAKRNYLKHDNRRTGKMGYKECYSCGHKMLTDETYCPKCGDKLQKDYTAGKYGHLVRR